MKKILLWCLLLVVLVLALLAAGATYVWFNSDALLSRLKPQLEKMTSELVGSTVTLGELSVSLLPTTVITIDRARIGSADRATEGIELSNLDLRVNPWALLRSEVEILTLSLRKPEITFIKEPSGVRIQGLPKERAPRPSGSTETAKETTPKGETSSLPIAISLRSFELTDGRFVLKEGERGREQVISKVSVRTAVAIAPGAITLPSLTISMDLLDRVPTTVRGDEIRYDLSSGLFEAKKLELSALGNTVNLVPRFEVPRSSGSASVSSEGIDLGSLSALGDLLPPAVRELGLRGTITPDIKASLTPGGYTSTGSLLLNDLGASSHGFAVSEGQGTVQVDASTSQKNVTIDPLTFTLNGQRVESRVKAALEDKAQIVRASEVTVRGFGGTFGASGELGLSGTKPLRANFSAEKLQISALLSILPQKIPAKISGTLTTKGAIAGALQGDVPRSLSGQTEIEVSDGVLHDVNLPAKVLQSIDSLPFLSGSLYSLVPPHLRPLLERKDTMIKLLKGTFSIRDSSLHTSDLLLVSDLFDLNGAGRIGFDSSLDLTTTISFSPELSEELFKRNEELRVAADDKGRLVVPLTLKGTPPQIIVLPDLKKLMAGAGRKVLEKEAGKLLDRALKGKRGDLKDILGF